MGKLTVDIETYSEIDITAAGLFRYASDPSFEVLLLSCAQGLQAPLCIDLTAEELPEDIREMLFDPSYTKHAHNAAFEWWCLSEHFHLTWEDRCTWLDQWECDMIHALYCGLPGSLGALGKALQQPEEAAKMKEGKALISYFCKPCKPTKANGGRTRNLPQHNPERWELFKKYNVQDVVAERENDQILAAWRVPEDVIRQWRDDVRMNAYGVAVDMGLTEAALDCAQQAAVKMVAEARALTRLSNPNSAAQLRAWLADRGVDLPDLRKETVSDILGGGTPLPADCRRMLELRLMMSKTSNKKYDAIKAATGPDGRIRGTLQFYGANRTGRWAGRLLQVQNLPRTYLKHQAEVRKIIQTRDAELLEALYEDVNDTLSQMIRTTLIPAKGCVFVDADFSAIEARLIAWEAGEDWVLDVFRTTGKIYEATAARIFGIPFETIVKGHPNYKYRQRGKVATLALGYQGSVGAMNRMGGNQLGLDEAGLLDIVRRWRKQNPNIVKLWRRVQDAAVETINTGKATHIKRGNSVLCVFRLESSTRCPFPFLTIELPSGRKLFYANPRTDDNGEQIYYMEQENAGWVQSESYGGKLVENITQAIGRDCLAFALDNLRAAGYQVVFHVHDEVVCEIPADSDPKAALKDIARIMSRPPVWAQDLPLNAEGWVGDFFTKD